MDSFQRTHEVALERFKRNLSAKEEVDEHYPMFLKFPELSALAHTGRDDVRSHASHFQVAGNGHSTSLVE